jgi:hypothetical protein
VSIKIFNPILKTIFIFIKEAVLCADIETEEEARAEDGG